MNVRQFSMGDLNDILISPEPVAATSPAPGSEDVEDDYEDEFEDDFEDEDSRRSGKSQEIEPFDISKSEDSKTYFEHAVQSPEQHARPDSRSVSGSNESDESDPNQLQGSRFEEEDVEAFEESMDAGRSVESPPKPLVRAKAFDRAAYLANMHASSASAPAPVRQQFPAPTPPDAPNASINKSSSFTRTLLAPPVAPKFSLPSAVFDGQLEVAAHAALPADVNEHPVPAAHFTSRRTAFATTVDTGEEMEIADAEARKKRGESDQSDSMLQAVRGPSAKGIPAFNAIRRVAAWEVPGGSAGGQNEAIKQATAAEQEKKSQEEDRSQLVLTVLELLQSAAKKSEAQREVEFAMKSSTTTHVSSFHMGGVTRAQAMQANGKFFMSRVPDYDPDFDSALQFLDKTTEDRTSETREKTARAELRALQEERERLRQKKEAQLSWERDANTSLESQSLGGAGSSPDASIQVLQVVNGSDGRDRKSRGLTMANRNLSGNPYRTANKTYPPGRAVGPHASASHGAQNMKENTTNNAHKTHPVSVRTNGADTERGNLRGSSDGEKDGAYPASPDTAASVTNTSPGASPGIHSGSPGLQQQGMGPMGAGGWPAPLQQRKDMLANLPVSRASQLNSTCESLYASFLADLIGNCKKRANECKDTEEMAMLKALSDHVFATFAGERLEDVQCKMLQGAVNVLDKIGPNKPSGEKTPLAQRLENPIRR